MIDRPAEAFLNARECIGIPGCIQISSLLRRTQDIDRGMAYERLGLRKRAILDLNKAIELEKSRSRLFRNRGKIYQSLGLNEEAAADFERAKKIEAHQEEVAP